MLVLFLLLIGCRLFYKLGDIGITDDDEAWHASFALCFVSRLTLYHKGHPLSYSSFTRFLQKLYANRLICRPGDGGRRGCGVKVSGQVRRDLILTGTAQNCDVKRSG